MTERQRHTPQRLEKAGITLEIARLLRIGEGNDTHRLVPHRPLVIGGVSIPSRYGSEGHSDADALIHAVVDAILGGMAKGDIGQHFPNTDPQWKGAPSLTFLGRTGRMAHEEGVEILNVDATVSLEQIRLRAHIDTMRENIAIALGIEIGRISVKAKSGEGVGPVGEGKSVEARAVVLLLRTGDLGTA